MNKFSKYLCIGALGLGLWSCSSDEPVSTENPTFQGEQALMTVNIFSPESMTRGDVSEDGDDQYNNGSADENAISKVDFYFYDKAGDYVTEYKGARFEYSDDSNPLVSQIGSSKIVLTNLPGKNYPAYMIAIANAPSSLNLTDLSLINANAEAKSVANQNVGSSRPWTTVDGKTSSFIMTSATHDGNSADFYYFATPLTPENFAEIKDDVNSGQGDPWTDKDGNAITTKPVDIYIERLAAKVELSFNSSRFTLTNGYYEMSLPTYEITTGYDSDGVAQTVKRDFKVRLYGWGVNGEAKDMRYFKRVNSVSSVNGPFKTSDGWDFNGTKRCYWARTPGYGTNSYPSSFEDVTKKTDDIYANNETLKYISWNDVNANSFANGNNIAYIRPHTEIGEQLNLSGNQLRHSAVTEVLIAGQLVDEAGKGVDLFQLGETYYTADGIINYILNSAGKHIWKKTGENSTSSIEVADVRVRYDYDGVFKFELTDNNTVWYSDKECTELWDKSSDISTNHKAVEKELNSFLPEKQTYGYKDGLLYYNIPIRHLRAYNSKENEEIKTGMFGVVRNHWYKITVNNLTNLGHSVYRPEEHIIPPSDDTQFMIGSSIKILNWRMVPQNVEL